MLLSSVHIQNFRCFRDLTVSDIGHLMLLIGPNDAGKSTFIDAVRLAFGALRPNASDFANPELEISIELTCCGVTISPPNVAMPAANGEHILKLRRVVAPVTLRVSTQAYGPALPEDIPSNFHALNAEQQKALLRSYSDVEPGSNKEERISQWQITLPTILKVTRWSDVDFDGLLPVLPFVQVVSSESFNEPEAELQKILTPEAKRAAQEARESYRRRFSTDDDAIDLISHASEAAQNALDESLEPLRTLIRSSHSDKATFQLTASVDYVPQVSITARIDTGDGLRPTRDHGIGTRRRLWMAVEQFRATKRGNGPILRLYDEPDANLHFEAQRRLFANIRSVALDPSTQTQVIMCTHAVTMIDRAPAEALRLLEVSSTGERSVRRITIPSEAGELKHLGDAGASVGLSNLVLLYERAFLLVEGDTEAEAVPLLYRTLFGTRFEDDGLRIVNLRTCGAWESVMRVLFANRASGVVMLLDQDCLHPTSSASLTPHKLASAQLDSSQVYLVGTKEFEDAFSDDAWIHVLAASLAREDGCQWDVSHLARARAAQKFSEALRDDVRNALKPAERNLTKPLLGSLLGKHALRSHIPTPINEALVELRRRAALIG